MADETLEPFSVTFDFDDDDHCGIDPDQTINESDLEGDVKKAVLKELWRFRGRDPEVVFNDLAEELDGKAQEIEDRDPEDVSPSDLDHASLLRQDADTLRSLAYDVSPHNGCSCASDMWDSCKDYFDDELLAKLHPESTWAVRLDNRREDKLDDVVRDDLSVDVLFQRIGRHYDWSRIALEWNGAYLHVTFEGYSLGRYDMVLTPLSKIQEEARDYWDESEGSGAVGYLVLEHADSILKLANGAWVKANDTDDDVEVRYPDLVDSFVEKARRYPDDVEAAAAIVENWVGTIDELFEAAQLVRHSAK